MIEYGFTYDPQTNPQVVLELIYTDGKESPIYYRDSGRWHEVPEDSAMLNFPVHRIREDVGDEPVEFWDASESTKDVITVTDVQDFLK